MNRRYTYTIPINEGIEQFRILRSNFLFLGTIYEKNGSRFVSIVIPDRNNVERISFLVARISHACLSPKNETNHEAI